MDEQNKRSFFQPGTPRCGILCAALGALVALMLLYLGFWRTLFIALLAAAGYFLGAEAHKADALKNLVNRLFPPKNE